MKHRKSCPYCNKRKINTVAEIVADKLECVETVSEHHEWKLDKPRHKPQLMTLKQVGIVGIPLCLVFTPIGGLCMLLFIQAILWSYFKDHDRFDREVFAWENQGYCQSCFKIWSNV